MGGSVYHFKSDNVWADPYELCDVGSVIDVLVNPNDYNEYYVDVDALVERKLLS